MASYACTSCGAESPVETPFCAVCGASREEDPGALRSCPSCGESAEEWQKYCDACGAAIESRSSPRFSEEGEPEAQAPPRLSGTEAVPAEAKAPKRWKLPVVLALGMVIGIALAVAPWVLFGGNDAGTAILLSPVPGEEAQRSVGDNVHIQGVLVEPKQGAKISFLVDGDSIWSGTYDGSPASAAPEASWEAKDPGRHEVAMEVAQPDGEVVKSDVAVVQVRG